MGMALMTWTDSMSVGVKALDEDHQKLITIINQLHYGIQAGQTKQALGMVLDQLIRYTRTHFQREEEMFARTNYPKTAEHKAEHVKLIATAADLQKRFQEGASSMLSLETMGFLKQWLTHHIQESDKSYRAHLNAKGIR
jgi:hemerythrin